MTEDRFDRMARIVEEAERLEGDALDQYLSQECSGDAEFRAEVESLLAADTRTVRDLAESPFRDLVNHSDMPQNALADTVIDSYLLVEEIGRGGLGVVYRAEHEKDGVSRDVALKIIKRGRDTDVIIRRFRQEREILASLTHPNIATLLDVGTTRDGLPYFVMEYIKGVSIDEYCDRKKLSTDLRLELFQKVCSVVHFAHKNLVVHRDLKPANILVTEEGEPILLDFGIAKLLKEGGGVDPSITLEENRVMTPEYASPEQVSGDVITTASDVYSLGTVLYELLTGQRAHRIENNVQKAILKAVCEDIPEYPSVIVMREMSYTRGDTTRTVTPEEIALAREGEPRRLQRRLAGDLDNIALMALRKEPDRRYSSAEQMAEDIGRHLAKEPVIAQEDSFWYRASKFVQRNTASVALASIIFLVVLSSSILLASQKQKTERERDRAERVSGFMVKLFESSDPYKTNKGDVTLRELVAEGALNIQSDFQGDSIERAKLLESLGDVYRSIGEYNRSESMLNESLGIYRRVLEDGHELFAGVHVALGRLYQVQADFERSEQQFAQAVEALKKNGRGKTVDFARALDHLGYLLYDMHEFERAEEKYNQALEILDEIGDPEQDSLSVVNNLALVYERQSKFDEAENLYRRIVEATRFRFGNDHPYTATALNNFGLLYQQQSRFDEAEPLHVEAVDIFKSAFGMDHPAVATVHATLGVVYKRQARYEEAMEMYKIALDTRERVLPENHYHIGIGHKNVGGVYMLQSRYEEAEPYLLRAMEITKISFGEGHAGTASSINDLAGLYLRKEEYSKAEVLYREALEIFVNARGMEHATTASIANNLSVSLRKLGRLEEAESLALEALSVQRKLRGDLHASVAYVLNNLGLISLERKDGGFAEEYLTEAVDTIAQVLGEDHPRTGELVVNLARAHQKQGDFEESEKQFRRALEISTKTLDSNHQQVLDSRKGLAEVLRDLGRESEAEEFEESLRSRVDS